MSCSPFIPLLQHTRSYVRSRSHILEHMQLVLLLDLLLIFQMIALCSGRTQKQVLDYIKEGGHKKVQFERKHSKIHSVRSLTAKPSEQHSEVPKQSCSFTYVDGADSPVLPSCQQGKELKLSVEDGGQRTTPSQKKSPKEGRKLDGGVMATMEEEEEVVKDRMQHSRSQTQQPSTGSLAGSPHLSELSINSQGGPGMANTTLSPNLSPDNRQASPLVSPVLNEQTGVRTDDEEEVRKKRFPTDKAYFIAKEVSTTERTYLKDLEVITSWFQSTVSKDDCMPEALKKLIFLNFEPLHKFHTNFLKEIEQRLALW
ncbi:FERM, ARHGEF and pleckstrin domain-containing protein 1 [Varanus komodoensis]|nr:FERM, ARHGEF and pleckstrin domain-containing protein 1 [Varanus komodoensis]